MGKGKKRNIPGINAGSMADIAFLLLIFFLMTTTIKTDKGLAILLPALDKKPEDFEINTRNLCKVLVNANDQLLVNGEPMDITELTPYIKGFVSNNGVDPNKSVDPASAIVSIKNDRGTSYKTYIKVMDKIRGAYNELRAEFLSVSINQYLELSRQKPEEKEKLDEAAAIYPLNVSEAEPSSLGETN